jgi:hypothetical protein
VFIASPGDLAPERKIFKDRIDQLNAGFADGAGVTFIPVAWEEVLAQTGRRTQAVINRQIEQCDLFLLALHRRWGQKAPDSSYSSYTEEEYQLALNLWRRKKSPEVLVFFKTVDSASLADPGPELKKVLGFRKQLEKRRSILIRPFNTELDFGNEVDRHLRAFARGEWKSLDAYSPEVKFPKEQVTALTKAQRAGQLRVERAQKRKSAATPRGKRKEWNVAIKADLSLVESHQEDLALARAAVDVARDGRIQDARILFAKATEGTTDLSILSVAAEFFRQIGDPENSSRLVERQAAIARDRRIAAEHYFALLPPGFMSAIREQMLNLMLSQFPQEVADELRDVLEEAFGGDKLEHAAFEQMVKSYTEAEIVHLARFLASSVGQSSLQKQQAMLTEMAVWGQREVEQVLLKRHPELAGNIGELQDASAVASPTALEFDPLAEGSLQGAAKTLESTEQTQRAIVENHGRPSRRLR